MATADEVVTILRADTAQHDARIEQSARKVETAANKIATSINKVDTSVAALGAAQGLTTLAPKVTAGAAAFDKMGQSAAKATGSLKTTNMELRYLPAQLNDIAVQLAGGQSPFLIAIQQGSQINQALGGMGLRGVVSALGGAFVGLLNPVSLATFALIGVAGVAVQYFTSLLDGGEKSEEVLRKEAQLIQQVAEQWGIALPALKAYADEQARLVEQQEKISALTIARDTVVAPIQAGVEQAVPALADLFMLLEQVGDTTTADKLREQWNKYVESVKAGNPDLKLLNTIVDEGIAAATKFGVSGENVISVLREIGDQADRSKDKLKGLNEELNRQGQFGPGMELAGPNINPVGVLPGFAPQPGQRPSFEDIGQSLDSLESAIKGFADRVVAAESGGNARAKNPNSTATGTGQFLESTWLDLFRRYYPEQAQQMGRQAILDLRENADVSYALIIRYAQENAKVLQAAGLHVDEAALQLSHFLGAGDAAKVLAAAPGTPLAGLISDAAIRANPTILGGGRTVDDARAYAERRATGAAGGTGRTRTRRTPEDIFQGSVDTIQKRIDMLNAEFEAQSKLNPAIKDYGFAAEKARIEAGLLADAQKAGLTVTPELAAKISQLAENYAKASASGKELETQQRRLVDQQQELNAGARDIFGGIIEGIRAGKSAGDILADTLDKIASKLSDIALNALFPSSGGGILGGLFGGGGGGLLGGILIPGILHEGGTAGSDGYDHSRAFSASTWAGARRMHGGGIAGLMPGEIPTILKKGEQVLTERQQQQRAVGSPAGGTIEVVGMFEVKNGNLVPLVTGVSGVVAGQQIRQANRQLPGRLAQSQARGT